MANIWTIWKERNLRCFECKYSEVDKLPDKVKYLVATWVSPLHTFKGILVNTIMHNWKEVAFSRAYHQWISPRWCPPPIGALKLNFDGSAAGNPGLTGFGWCYSE